MSGQPEQPYDDSARITWRNMGDVQIVVGGRDLAQITRSATLRLAASEVPTLTLELDIIDLKTSTDGHLDIAMDEHTRALLALAGWRDRDYVASLGRSVRIEAQRADQAEQELAAMRRAAQGGDQ